MPKDGVDFTAGLLLTFLVVKATKATWGNGATSTYTHPHSQATHGPPPPSTLHPSPPDGSLNTQTTHTAENVLFFSSVSVHLSQRPPPQTGNLSFHSSSGPLIPFLFILLFFTFVFFIQISSMPFFYFIFSLQTHLTVSRLLPQPSLMKMITFLIISSSNYY